MQVVKYVKQPVSSRKMICRISIHTSKPPADCNIPNSKEMDFLIVW